MSKPLIILKKFFCLFLIFGGIFVFFGGVKAQERPPGLVATLKVEPEIMKPGGTVEITLYAKEPQNGIWGMRIGAETPEGVKDFEKHCNSAKECSLEVSLEYKEPGRYEICGYVDPDLNPNTYPSDPPCITLIVRNETETCAKGDKCKLNCPPPGDPDCSCQENGGVPCPKEEVCKGDKIIYGYDYPEGKCCQDESSCYLPEKEEGPPKPPKIKVSPETKIPPPAGPIPGKEAGAPIIKEPQMPTPKEGCEKTKSCQSCPSECVCSCKSSCEKDCKKYEDDLEAYGKCINECKEKASGGILPCNKKYDDPSTRGCDCCPCSLCSLFLLLKRTIDFLFYPLAFALFIISLIISGILFITQGGRPERIKAARNTLTLSCLGFGLILASWVLINTWLGVLTKETEGGIATIFGKRWNQIECPLPKGECTIFQPPLPQRYYCGDGFVIGDEECDPKEPYFRFYLRTKGTINSWFKTLSLCTERCILKCTKIPDLEKIGLRCQDLNNNGKIEPEERCLEGKYVCDPSIGERGKVICADVYADPKWKDHPDYIGKRLGDFCCEFRMPTEEERALATSATKIVPIVDGKVVSCKVACQKIGKICIGIGSYDELNCAYPYSPRSSCCTEPPGGCGYYFCLWAGKGDCDLAGGRLPPGVRLGRPCIDRGEYLAKSKRCDLTTPLRPNYSWCYCL